MDKQILTDMPLAGESLTTEVGSRPWQQPPQFNTPEQAIKHYFTRLTDPEDSVGILNALEMGVPVETLTEAIQLGGVMQGLHTIDIGILVSPVIAETISQMAEKAGIEYTLKDEEKEEDKMPEELEIQLATKDLQPERKPMLNEQLEVPEKEIEETNGLMSRRMM